MLDAPMQPFPSDHEWIVSFPSVCVTLAKFLTSVTQYKPPLCSPSLPARLCPLGSEMPEWVTVPVTAAQGKRCGQTGLICHHRGGNEARCGTVTRHTCSQSVCHPLLWRQMCVCACLLWPTLIKFIHAIGLFRSAHKSTRGKCKGNEWMLFYYFLVGLSNVKCYCSHPDLPG